VQSVQEIAREKKAGWTFQLGGSVRRKHRVVSATAGDPFAGSSSSRPLESVQKESVDYSSALYDFKS
jgi:hypothetical protein